MLTPDQLRAATAHERHLAANERARRLRVALMDLMAADPDFWTHVAVQAARLAEGRDPGDTYAALLVRLQYVAEDLVRAAEGRAG